MSLHILFWKRAGTVLIQREKKEFMTILTKTGEIGKRGRKVEGGESMGKEHGRMLIPNQQTNQLGMNEIKSSGY